MTKTILLVEDDRMLLGLLTHVLRGAGYEVLSFGRPSDAVRHSAARQVVDLLIADIVMRGTDGYELAELVCASHPAVQVLLISGYPDGMGERREKWRFLAKPFSPSELLEAARSLLEVTA